MADPLLTLVVVHRTGKIDRYESVTFQQAVRTAASYFDTRPRPTAHDMKILVCDGARVREYGLREAVVLATDYAKGVLV